MDDTTLESLRAAFEQSPDNLKLLFVLLEAYLERGEEDEGYELLLDRDISDLTDLDQRLVAARIFLGAGDAERALATATPEPPETPDTPGVSETPPTPELGIICAHALVALDRREEGAEAYKEAVAANPTLEDPDLERQLNVKVKLFDKGKGQPPLKLVTQGDADESIFERMLIPEPERVTFEDVGGLEGIKRQIRKKIILPFQKPSLFQRFRKRVGGGILLYGPPGCGKTLLARATAGECDAEFFNVAIADVLDMYFGESEAKLHALFEQARNSAPSVVFFDELEALGGRRQYQRDSSSSKLVSQFLSELDGYTQENQNILVLGATNVPWAVDLAFRRPGRFDRVLFVPPPDKEARRRILEIHFKERPVEQDLDLKFLAAKSPGFSGADLRNLVETCADLAIEESLEKGVEVPITNEVAKGALKEVKATTYEWLTTARNHARYANEGGMYDEVLDFLNKHGGK
jgi:SpoVK/Ycf46/Vps4 family AAA+-type ATPase